MFYEHNKFVNELLQDPDLLQKYSDMAKEENSVETRIQAVEESNQAGAAPPKEFVFVFECVRAPIHTAAFILKDVCPVPPYRSRTKLLFPFPLRLPILVIAH